MGNFRGEVHLDHLIEGLPSKAPSLISKGWLFQIPLWSPWRVSLKKPGCFDSMLFGRLTRAPTSQASEGSVSAGRVLRPDSSLVFARCVFTSPCAPDGPGVAPRTGLRWGWLKVEVWGCPLRLTPSVFVFSPLWVGGGGLLFVEMSSLFTFPCWF